MLSDRTYMRDDDYVPRRTTVLVWLMCALVAGFVMQLIAEFIGARAIERLFAVSPPAITSGFLWTLVSYAFMHGGPIHLLGSLLGVYFLGRELITLLGEKQFLGLFFGAAIIGALAWLGVHFRDGGGGLVGASAAIAALFTLYICLNPDRQITLLLFFVLPVTIPKARILGFILAGFDLFGLVFWEILKGPNSLGIAHSAHLGGMAAGLLFYRFVHQRAWETPDRNTSSMELPKWIARKPPAPVAEPKLTATPPTTRESLKAEIDRILDKINSQGFGSLTPEERRKLDQAKDLLSRN